ncbi:MAG: cell division protein FtsZ [Desulfobacterales bacterium]|nr:cell division protein FtsZ [Desulfobacterales bacterium]
MFTYVDNEKSAKIKVIGVGGAGGNAINNMIRSGLQGVKFIAANTDAQALEISQADVRIQLGDSITEGLGAGANPQIGRDAALETVEEIRNALRDSHMVFITAGLGGGTGTGATPVIAEICREMGALTVAVVTQALLLRRQEARPDRRAGAGRSSRKCVDTAITIPNDRLRALASKKATLMEMFMKADEILLHAVKGITDLIMMPGLVNLDFADVRTTMSKAGMALMGIGISSGENRAIEAAEKAISHPLLEDISIAGAKGVLMNITASSSMEFEEVAEASERIHKEVGEEAEIFWGTSVDDSLGDEMRVTVIATGIGAEVEALPGSGKRTWPRTRSTRRRRSSSRCGARSATSPRPTWSAPTSSTSIEPTFIRHRRAVGETSGALYRGVGRMALDDNGSRRSDLPAAQGGLSTGRPRGVDGPDLRQIGQERRLTPEFVMLESAAGLP